MSENPLLKNIPLIKDLEQAGKTISDMVDDIYDKRLDINFKYDPKSFKDRLTVNPFRVDGFARITFVPRIEVINIIQDKNLDLTATNMPSFYQHKMSLWQISLTPNFSSIVKEQEDLVGDLNKHLFEFDELPFETTFYFRVKYYTNVSYTDWSEPAIIRTRDLLPIPVPTLTGEILSLRQAELHSTPYLHLDLPHTKTTWQIATSALFSTIIFNKATEISSEFANIVCDLEEDLITDHNYFARVKFHNKLIESEWSEPKLIKIAKIEKPIINTVTLETPTTFKVVSSEYVHPLIDHTESEWELSSEIDFTIPILNIKNETDLLQTTFTLDTDIPLDDDITYYFRVRYYSDTAFSDWSDTKVLNIVNIEKPVINELSIVDNSKIHIKASDFVHSLLTHESTTYQIAKNNEFLNPVIDMNMSDNLTEITIPMIELDSLIDYFVRVRYHNGLVESEWSDIKVLKTDVPKPIIASVTVTPAYDFSIVSSAFIHEYLTHTRTLWEVSYLNNFLTMLTFSEDVMNLTSNVIDVGIKLKPNTNYYFRNKYRCGNLASEYSDTFILKTDPLTKPEIVSYSYTPETKIFSLTGKTFSYMDLIHTKSVWEMSKTIDFEISQIKTMELPLELNVITFEVLEDIGETDYYFRLKHFSDEFESVYSEIINIKTPSLGAISTPTITQPGLLCPYNFVIEASLFEQIGGITQTKTIWQICENDQFLEGDPTLKEITVDGTSDQSFTSVLIDSMLIEEGKTYFVRVKYLSEPDTP